MGDIFFCPACGGSLGAIGIQRTETVIKKCADVTCGLAVRFLALNFATGFTSKYRIDIDQLIPVYRYWDLNPACAKVRRSSTWATLSFITNHVGSKPVATTRRFVKLSELDGNGICRH